jgi:hypothetical protein
LHHHLRRLWSKSWKGDGRHHYKEAPFLPKVCCLSSNPAITSEVGERDQTFRDRELLSHQGLLVGWPLTNWPSNVLHLHSLPLSVGTISGFCRFSFCPGVDLFAIGLWPN